MSRALTLRLVVALSACCTVACDQPEDLELDGHLYFGAGYYLGQFNLQSGNSEVVANLGEVSITHIDNLDDGRLLLSLTRDRPGRGRYGVFAFDPETYQSTRWLTGASARYLPSVDAIVYDDGLALKAVDRTRLRGEATTLFVHRFDARVSVLELPNAEILFAVEPRVGTDTVAGPVIHHYRFSDGSLSTLTRLSSVCDLDGALWIDHLERVLCRPPDDDEASGYRLVILDGQVERTLALPEGKRFYAVASIEEAGVVIFTETSRGWFDRRPRTSVWAHDLNRGITERRVDNQYLGTFVAYREPLR